MPDELADAFLSAAARLVEEARRVDPARLDEPATDAWSVRELVAHAVRGVLTVQSTLASPVDESTRMLADASAYFTAAMATPRVHEGIVGRARGAAAAVGDDPGGYASAAYDLVAPLVTATPMDRVVQHFAGRLSFGAYLRTRIVELTLHTVDLQVALGAPVSFPVAPATIARDTLLGVADRADPLALACAISGRGAALACNVLG